MKDAQGLDVQVGDPVMVRVGTEWIRGHAVKLQDGGLAVASTMPTKPNDPSGTIPDAIVLQVGLAFAMERPGTPHSDLLKLAGPNAVESMAKQLKPM